MYNVVFINGAAVALAVDGVGVSAPAYNITLIQNIFKPFYIPEFSGLKFN